MITHDEYMKKLPPARQAKIKARAEQLLAEELTLRDLRKALRLSQETVAELLGMRQGDLSKFERRSDAYISTIRRYVEAMGGSLYLVAEFPNREPVHLINIGDLEEERDKCQENSLSDAPEESPVLAPSRAMTPARNRASRKK